MINYGTSLQRERETAVQATVVSARKVQKLFDQVDAFTTQGSPSAFETLQRLKRKAEQLKVQAQVASRTQTGNAADSWALVAGGQKLEEQFGLVKSVAEYAAKISDAPFGEDLSRRVAHALRAGVQVRNRPEDRVEVSGRHLYTGVGLSYGGTGKLDSVEAHSGNQTVLKPEEEVVFSVDSCWYRFCDHQPTQHCQAVALGQSGQHMGHAGLSPSELAPEACKSLPSTLTWAHEEAFVKFLAAQSERSLALLLGSGANGSITYDKMMGAVQRFEHYVPGSTRTGGIAGSTWDGDRAFILDSVERSRYMTREGVPSFNGACVLRDLANAQEALNSLEGAVLAAARQWRSGELEVSAAISWLQQLRNQAHAVWESLVGVPADKLGIPRAPALGLQGDLLKRYKQLSLYMEGFSKQLAEGATAEVGAASELGLKTIQPVSRAAA
mmetsp:Transcript_4451/g.8048  ORF Transcript_4451/g.8048 Transcript_4451/m.8048 type:complete len:441 (-) Transcript_4451:3-1325(-)